MRRLFAAGNAFVPLHDLYQYPTHRVEYWDGLAWTRSSLQELGLIVYLGHRGKPCFNNEGASQLLIGDLNGFHTVNLLSAGYVPCSDIHPRSAFTHTLLEVYNTFLTLGRTSAHKFYAVLERQTSPGFPEDVKYRYRELMTTHRKWLFLENLARAAHQFDVHPTDTHPGDQALDCVACPQPTINFNWDEVPEDERVWFRRFVSYDGNFRSVRKGKKVEAGDICLSDGQAYFPPKEEYKEWVEAQKQPQRSEKPACDHHKAASDTSVRGIGRDVTGIGSLTCTSHSCFVPRGTVDFFKGERFVYADYAFASAVTHLTRADRLAFGLTYDIWCHWTKNWDTRRLNLPDSLALPPDFDLVGAIPKWHLVGHDISCYVRYSLDNTQKVGRLEGEGCERVWAHLNEHSGSTSEQGPGVRTDTINNLAYEWNFEKMVRISQHLPTKFKEARRMYLKQKAAHLELAMSIDPDDITIWEGLPLTPVQVNGKWVSPLMDPVWTDGSFQTTIQEETAKETSTARVGRRRPGATRWLSDGIELQHNMRNIRDEAQEIGQNPTPRQAESLNKQRLNLRDRITQFQKRGVSFMGVLSEQEPDHPDLIAHPEDDEPESTDLGLPSSFAAETLDAAGLSSLVDLERDLRRSMCNDSLESLRSLLGARAFAINYKKRHERGQVQNTRSEAAIRRHTAKIEKTRWRYNNSRDALFRLGPNDTDANRYQIIKDEDLKSLKSYLEEDSRGTGQGYSSMPWIWRNNPSANHNRWQVEALKTEWFRSRERYRRWEEQLVLLKREMTMAIRTFRTREDVWKWRGESGSATPGMRGYAIRQSRFFGELARRALHAFRPNLNDDIVTLKWSEAWLSANVNDFGFT
ncbi:hypothetical protein FRC12_014689 [Ceratobasidium sp. 428]|nr:hypothetical protein FRC12_014689 [Ceratobasidium sp. 428]